MTANKPMTGEQLDELMTAAVNMQRDAETDFNRPSAMFAYAVQVAVLELRKARVDAVKISESKRYWISPNGIACEDENGKFVKHEDYAALEQRLGESQREFRADDATIENMQMQVEKLAAENAGLNTFVDALLSIAWQGGSADGADIQDLALKHGLLRQEVYSADEHETLVDDPGNFEDGDPVYFRVETPATDAFLAEVRAQGVEIFASSLKVIGGHEHPYSVVANEFAAQLRNEVKPCPHCGGTGTCSASGCTATDQMIEQYRNSKGVQS